jgi:hypothetical protein
MFLNLQSGKFDTPDRMFHNIADTWRACQRDSHDVKVVHTTSRLQFVVICPILGIDS